MWYIACINVAMWKGVEIDINMGPGFEAEMERIFLNVDLSQTFEEAQSTLLEAMKETRN